MSKRRGFGISAFLIVFSFISTAWAAPDCMDGSSKLSVDNAQVLKWKSTTANQFLARGYVDGTVSNFYADRNGHHHFEIKIGPDSSDTLEVVYNDDFGSLGKFSIGDSVQACGDYITSNAATKRYPPSPDNAIIHWVHVNPSLVGRTGSVGGAHASGFLVINGTVFGDQIPANESSSEDVRRKNAAIKSVFLSRIQ